MGKGPETIIDPTKNVLDVVEAERQRQDSLREAESRYQNEMRAAAVKRLDDLTAQARFYQTEIAVMLAKSVESTSSLVSTQLLQIQTILNERVSKLEQFRYESSGRGTGLSAGWGYLIGAATLVVAVIAIVTFFVTRSS